MGSIRERRRQDGSIGYTAQIILKRKGKDTYREAQTFDRRTSAVAWLKNREAELKQDGGIERARMKGKTLSDAIDLYFKDVKHDIGRTKAGVLKAVKGYSIGNMQAEFIKASDIVAFARDLSDTGMKPQTVQNYLSHLSAVFAVARTGWGVPLDRQAMQDAFSVAKRLGLTSKSEKRGRRPTLAEINKLMDHFTVAEQRNPGMVPMTRIIPFAMFSTRRLGEICRIKWSDFDRHGQRVMVRDMKHPGEKAGNDQWVDVPQEAVGFMGGPQTSGRIFPYTEDAIGANFTRACKLLEIEDLHFHDLRHEGISRLFEMGKTIPQAASVSGHRSWSSLQRYTHLRHSGDKWANWKWLKA